MQDEHFMQLWNAGHARFSEDFDRLARRACRGTAGLLRRRKNPAAKERPLARQARLTGIGIVAGIMAGSSIAMVTPLVQAGHCPPVNQQACAHAALA